MDVVQEISQFNAGRDPERLQLKYQRMRSDPFVFLRGTCHLFYQRMPKGGLFKSAPPVWSCGDLHLENFGSYKGDNRLAYFDMNDFDEGVLAPATWDLVRMLTSMQVGAKSLGLKPGDALVLCDSFLDSYGAALMTGKAYWVEPQTAHGLVGSLLDGLRDRRRADFLNVRTQLKSRKRTFKPDRNRVLPVDAAQREKVITFMDGFSRTQANPEFFQVLDVARRIAGTGSLGVDRYAILVHGKGSPDGNYLLDLKEAQPSSLAPYLKVKQPRWTSQAHRVVEVQHRMQAVSMAFLQPVSIDHTSYVLRALQPTEDRVSIDGARQTLGEKGKAIAAMGGIAAWGQLRSSGRQGSATADELIEFASGKKWKRKLLEASKALAEQTMQDAATFDSAFDDGAFRL